MIFIETSVFTRQIKELVSDEEYSAFQVELANGPEAGDVIQGTGEFAWLRRATESEEARG